MTILLKIVSYIGLGLTLLPSLFVFAGTIDLATNKTLMTVGTLLWFFTVPFWINKEKQKIKV